MPAAIETEHNRIKKSNGAALKGQAVNFTDTSFYSTQSSVTTTTFFSTAMGYDSQASSMAASCPLKKDSPVLKQAFITLI